MKAIFTGINMAILHQYNASFTSGQRGHPVPSITWQTTVCRYGGKDLAWD